MNQIEDYIIVKNTISKDVCKQIIDDCNTRQWKKHQWNNYTTRTNTSEQTKELDVMPSTKNQQDKLNPSTAKGKGIGMEITTENKYETKGNYYS